MPKTSRKHHAPANPVVGSPWPQSSPKPRANPNSSRKGANQPLPTPRAHRSAPWAILEGIARWYGLALLVRRGRGRVRRQQRLLPGCCRVSALMEGRRRPGWRQRRRASIAWITTTYHWRKSRARRHNQRESTSHRSEMSKVAPRTENSIITRTYNWIHQRCNRRSY